MPNIAHQQSAGAALAFTDLTLSFFMAKLPDTKSCGLIFHLSRLRSGLFTASRTRNLSALDGVRFCGISCGRHEPIQPPRRMQGDRLIVAFAAALSKKWEFVCKYVMHTRQGKDYTRSGIHSAFRRAGKRIGIEGADPKSLRPFASAEAKSLGYDIEGMQDALGHTNIATTQEYLRKNARVRSNVVLKLPKKP
jgi:hypothetical protein